jgi:Tol biopolymer transport system component
MRILVIFLVAGTVAGVVLAAAPPAAKPTDRKLLIAFASVRDRRAPPYPQVFFYEHDGVSKGKILGSIPSITKGTNFTRSDSHPSLSGDGRYCAFAAQFGVQDGGRIEVWDRKEKKLLALPAINPSPNVHQIGASLSSDGKQIAFTAWARPGSGPRWGVFVYDRTAGKCLDLPRLNHDTSDQRMPAISADGRFLAYASNARNGVGMTDVYLYDVKEKKALALPQMNSKRTDMQPSLSGDGRLIAFSSDRPGGKGGRDIYLYDRKDKKFLPLPGLNSLAHEQSPFLSADGRYLAFVSERLGGAGERDVYLYDRQTRKLLPTPGLNSREDDYDPCVIVLPAGVGGSRKD